MLQVLAGDDESPAADVYSWAIVGYALFYPSLVPSPSRASRPSIEPKSKLNSESYDYLAVNLKLPGNVNHSILAHSDCSAHHSQQVTSIELFVVICVLSKSFVNSGNCSIDTKLKITA